MQNHMKLLKSMESRSAFWHSVGCMQLALRQLVSPSHLQNTQQKPPHLQYKSCSRYNHDNIMYSIYNVAGVFLQHGVDCIVVILYWGREYSYFPDETALYAARHLAELGVDVVVGYHPHLLQDHAYFGNTLIIFSPGYQNIILYFSITAQRNVPKSIAIRTS